MHTPVEVCCLDDIDRAARLVAEFVRSVREDTDFRPFYYHGNGATPDTNGRASSRRPSPRRKGQPR